MTDTTLQNMEIYVKSEEAPKKSYDTQMTSSTISTISSLASPVDSGVQLLDSESELTSAMSNVSGCETDTASSTFTEDQKHIQQLQDEALAASRIKESETWTDLKAQCASGQNGQGCAKLAMEKMEKRAGKGIAIKQFTESDFVNKNVVDEKLLSRSVPNYFDKFSEKENMHKHGRLDSCKSLSDEVFEMEHPIKSNTEVDLMNISLNSYELLDYTLQNANLKTVADSDPVDMHISMSEEVNENLKVVLDGKEAPPPIIKEVPVIENPETKATEEQIVFRRQRKKKSKSDTPKKRVSFHEDILNSTKIDDIHINLGFITHEPDVSLSFFQRGFVRKPDVVKGRSIDEEDSGSDENVQKKEPTQKQPKSSCLKKTKHKKYIDTKIVQEGVDFKKKKSESNLLDSNIFGSLKNILSFSTSVPLAERGVPEGQEDVVIYSSSQNLSSRRKSFENFSFANAETIEVAEVKPEPVSKVNLAKTNLKLTKSEGFYPNYPNQEIPENIILCDSNVYEHKGISYSYEYDNFQKNFEKQQKPKSSMMYQRILKEFNFFRRKAQEEAEVEVDDFEIINNQSTPTKPEVKIEEVFEVELPESDLKTCSTSRSTLSKYASSSKLDWSDNETVSDMSECRNSRHLDSPKRKARRSNHYTLSPFKIFPIRSAYTTNGDSKPLLLVLTNRAIYVVSSKQSTEFSTHFVLPYTDLNAILIGPNSQTVHFSNNDTDMQCILTTGCSKITNDLIGQIEIAMRRDANKPALPAVKHLSMRDMTNLRRAICKQTTVNKDEQYYYYSIVHIQDFVCEESPTPLGPSKEGPLMFKSTDRDSNRWETAYFILKAGVLYMLSSVSQRVPMRVFPLMNGACQGARRVFNSHRPHTFQLIVEGNSLLLAAPDEYVASEWLQELIHAASGIYNNYKDKNATQSCSLLMTSDHILTVREAFPCSINSLLPAKTRHEPIKGPQALSCAAITDLIAFRLPSAEQSWCVLEFSCREVHEYTGDWIIYFSTNSELETFISTLEMLWQYGNENGDSFPLSTIPETDPLSKKCIDTYRLLFDNWLPNTVHLQFM
ncbi:hypothetical protein YQE_06143, partial [Dendroctonus ponderosae]